MSNVEMNNMEVTEGRLGTVEQWLAKTEEEKKQDLIQAIASERIELTKFTKESRFLKDLYICFMSPKNFPSTECYEKLAKMIGDPSFVFQRLNRFSKILDLCVQRDSLLETMTTRIAVADQPLEANLFFNISPSMFDEEFIDFLDKRALELSTWTIEDWTTIQKIFEQKQLPFSQEFVKRCERVAQKAIAA